MSFGALPVSLILSAGTLACACIVFLYLLRSPQRRIKVRSLLLYRKASAEGQRRLAKTKLRRIYSLAWQLLILFALILALLQPKWRALSTDQIVLAFDVSASMCRKRGEMSPLDEAKEKAKGFLQSISKGKQRAIVSVGTDLKVMNSFTDDAAVLMSSLERLECEQGGRDLKTFSQWSWGALSNARSPGLLFFTEDALTKQEQSQFKELGFSFAPKSALRMEVVPLSTALDLSASAQLAITSFSARSQPGDIKNLQVLLEISNFGTEPRDASLALYQIKETTYRAAASDFSNLGRPPYLEERRLLKMERISLEPKERKRRLLGDLTRDGALLIAEVAPLKGRDAFSADNLAYFALPPRRERLVQIIGLPSTYLEAALLLDPRLKLQVVSSVRKAHGDCDVRIYLPGHSPEKMARCPEVYLGPKGRQKSYPVELGKELRMVGFDEWSESSSLFQSYDPYQIQILKAYAARLKEGQSRLAGSREGALVVAGRRDGHNWLALTFQPEESDFVLRAAWPIFLQELIRSLAPETASPELLSLQSGVPEWAAQSLSKDSRLRLVGPGGLIEGSLSTQGPGSLSEVLLPKPGFYQIKEPREFSYLASSIYESPEAFKVPVKPLAVSESLLDRRTNDGPAIWKLAALFALLLFGLEVFLFHRGRTL